MGRRGERWEEKREGAHGKENGEGEREWEGGVIERVVR